MMTTEQILASPAAAKVRQRLADAILATAGNIDRAAAKVTNELLTEAEGLGWPESAKGGIRRTVEVVAADLVEKAKQRALAKRALRG